MAARETKRSCRCTTACEFVITIKNELSEANDNADDDDAKEGVEKWAHCHVCRSKVKVNDDIDDEGDYIMCISCKRASPTCSCGSRGVEPNLDGTWGEKCVECLALDLE